MVVAIGCSAPPATPSATAMPAAKAPPAAQAPPAAKAPPVDSIRMVGSWTGDELRAFRTVLDVFEARTGHRVDYVETRDLRGVIQRGLDDHDPPDVSGLAGPAHLLELAKAGALENLGDAIEIAPYKAQVAPAFIELGSVDGRLVGAFIKSTVKGLIWYNPRVFRRGTPMTWDDLQRMAGEASTGDTRSWCIGLASHEASGWPGTDWIETIVLRQSGPEAYDAWVGGRLSWTSREISGAFRLFGQVVAEDSVFGGVRGALGTDFADAGRPLFTLPPGCLFLQQASFMPAFFVGDGRIPGEDFDFFPFPELAPEYAGSIVGAGDLIGLLTTKPAARELVAFLLSAEGQEAWVATGGALSVNPAVDTYPTRIAEREAAYLRSADHFRFDASDQMPSAMSDAFRHAILEYVGEPRRLDEILAGLEIIRRVAYPG